jgi:hypothetical protein
MSARARAYFPRIDRPPPVLLDQKRERRRLLIESPPTRRTSRDGVFRDARRAMSSLARAVSISRASLARASTPVARWRVSRGRRASDLVRPKTATVRRAARDGENLVSSERLTCS